MNTTASSGQKGLLQSSGARCICFCREKSDTLWWCAGSKTVPMICSFSEEKCGVNSISPKNMTDKCLYSLLFLLAFVSYKEFHCNNVNIIAVK